MIVADAYRRRGVAKVEDLDPKRGPLDSVAKRNAFKRSGFERPFQAQQSRLGMAS